MAKNKKFIFNRLGFTLWGRSLFALFLIGWCLWLCDRLFPLNLTRYEDRSTIIYGSNQEYLQVFLTQDEKFRLKTTPREVPLQYLQTLKSREDRFFSAHFGINPLSLFRALYQGIKSGHRVSGGSTITMQTARLLEPRKRTLLSKIIECLRSMQLEWHFAKDEILTIYMTLAPFGSNIEGVSAASWVYFNKIPQTLNPAEIALLVAMVQSPNALRPDRYPIKAKQARNKILSLMQSQGTITASEYQIYQDLPIPAVLRKFPREIPHLAWRLKQQYPKQTQIYATINPMLQRQTEHILAHYQTLLPKAANVAILIVDYIHNKPLVYIGSRNFYDFSGHGFVDYIQAYRSPGSTLKPFIYGLAFDSGLIGPNTFLLDAHRRFGSYHPRNFDKNTQGMVKASVALASSLNIPAVKILNDIGVIRFLSLLKEVGVNPKFPKSLEAPSLPTALGGLGMTLEQLVLLYSGLGNGGIVQPFSYIESCELQAEKYLFSTHAAKQITDILTVENSKGSKIAIKTGTSYGHRDALAIGYDKQYVIGIWIGVPNGTPMREATGAQMAVPLLHKIKQILPAPRVEEVPSDADQSSLTLKNLSNSAQHTLKQHQDSLTLLFPVDASIIERQSIPCTIQGGTQPYTWLIDGKPVSQSWQQKYLWIPQAPGHYSLSVVDSTGKSVQAIVEIN